jgi:aminoglycoside phosphotransferase (APT) family kinase protein
MQKETRDRLAAWLRTRMPDASEVRILGHDRVELGHSAEMIALTIATRTGEREHRSDVVVRLRPTAPGLLEPYDLERQFEILRALDGTAVRAPRALWLEPSGDVLGRPFFVMERADGQVYERRVPESLRASPARLRRMSESFVEQLAAIHLVDLRATGLDALGDGRDYLGRELAHWASEMHRVQRGPLPALERLLAALHERRHEPCPRITLVHGDAKPGNFAFAGDEVSAVFDWEMASIGDPRADVGYAEMMGRLPSGLPSCDGWLDADALVARWEARTGIPAQHREWYRAFQGFKTTVIMLVGAMLFDAGHSDDLRLAEMGGAVAFFTTVALRELGIDDDLDAGPVTARETRVRRVREARASEGR